MNAKNVLQKKLSKEHMQSNLKTLRHTRKILLYADKKKTTWWRISSAQQKHNGTVILEGRLILSMGVV
jgi:hypothetical protein